MKTAQHDPVWPFRHHMVLQFPAVCGNLHGITCGCRAVAGQVQYQCLWLQCCSSTSACGFGVTAVFVPAVVVQLQYQCLQLQCSCSSRVCGGCIVVAVPVSAVAVQL